MMMMSSSFTTKAFLYSTNIGLPSIGQVASTGAQSDLMDSAHWVWRCMLQLQEAENWNEPAATTWAAEFLLREDESREFVDQLKCGTRGKEKTSQASDYVLISMRKVATHDWSSCVPRM
jgi:hypothetical protein